MSPSLATSVFVLVIAGLFALDRDREVLASPALWIPVLWLMIIGSRPVSVWMDVGQTIDSPEKYLDGSPLDAAVFGGLIVAGLIVLCGRRNQVGTILRANWPILLFFVYCAFSTLWSDYTFVSFKRWIKAVGDLVMVLVVVTDPEPLAALKRIFARTGFALIPLSVLFIKYYPDLGRSYNPWTWEPFYSGVTLFKNELGMICLIFGLASVWRLTSAFRYSHSRDRVRHMIAHGILIGMVIWLFWMANSMTSLSCFSMAGSLIVLTSLFRSGRTPVILHCAVALVVCVSFSVLFLNVGGGALETMGRDPTLTGRTEIWDIVLNVAGNPFLGTGFESFWLGGRLQKIWDAFVGLHLQEAHNGYLEVYLNLGWIGVTLLAAIIVTGYRNATAIFRQDPEAGSLRLALFVAGVIYSFTEAGFRMLTPIWTLFLLATINVPRATATEELPAPEVEPSYYPSVKREEDTHEPVAGACNKLGVERLDSLKQGDTHCIWRL